MEKDELKNIYFIYVNRLNLLNPEYFNDKGTCSLDSRFILNHNFPPLTLKTIIIEIARKIINSCSISK